jgi:hypothetical protein
MPHRFRGIALGEQQALALIMQARRMELDQPAGPALGEQADRTAKHVAFVPFGVHLDEIRAAALGRDGVRGPGRDHPARDVTPVRSRVPFHAVRAGGGELAGRYQVRKGGQLDLAVTVGHRQPVQREAGGPAEVLGQVAVGLRRRLEGEHSPARRLKMLQRLTAVRPDIPSGPAGEASPQAALDLRRVGRRRLHAAQRTNR